MCDESQEEEEEKREKFNGIIIVIYRVSEIESVDEREILGCWRLYES